MKTILKASLVSMFLCVPLVVQAAEIETGEGSPVKITKPVSSSFDFSSKKGPIHKIGHGSATLSSSVPSSLTPSTLPSASSAAPIGIVSIILGITGVVVGSLSNLLNLNH